MMSPKRRFSSVDDEGPEPKRSKLGFNLDELDTTDAPLDPSHPLATSGAEQYGVEYRLDDDRPIVSTLLSIHSQSRQAIQRSIALVLRHDGFDSITPEALESFTQLVETCES